MSNTDGYLKMVFKAQTRAHSLEYCWSEGYSLGYNNQEETNNPYDQSSKKHQYWKDGWWAGFYREDHLFPQFAIKGAESLPEQPGAIVQMRSWLKSHQKAVLASSVGVGVVLALSVGLLDAA